MDVKVREIQEMGVFENAFFVRPNGFKEWWKWVLKFDFIHDEIWRLSYKVQILHPFRENFGALEWSISKITGNTHPKNSLNPCHRSDTFITVSVEINSISSWEKDKLRRKPWYPRDRLQQEELMREKKTHRHTFFETSRYQRHLTFMLESQHNHHISSPSYITIDI